MGIDEIIKQNETTAIYIFFCECLYKKGNSIEKVVESLPILNWNIE